MWDKPTIAAHEQIVTAVVKMFQEFTDDFSSSIKDCLKTS